MASLYKNGQLVVAAIRVLTHRHNGPPSVDAVTEMLNFSSEQANLICSKLHELGIIELLEGGFGTRLFVRDHAKLEELPDEEQTPAFAEAIKKFQEERKSLTRKVDAIKAEQAEKKKALHAELEKQLREKLVRKPPK
ncbi:MAG TPA: hypothetical protein ENF48_00640 [Desulfobacteraceae bacterium]|nr:hypothetical protein [Deltaproteobacteria bacterium]MBW2357016.1 hypothetical protein [Deltaproteobacteria bacterium]RLB96071.1 MAG: hypothetical protein DRH76_07250 [Deltaproteobacteria bacterium]HDI58858.1 hypothetical protein [Desulfobacteraceae bacterium]